MALLGSYVVAAPPSEPPAWLQALVAESRSTAANVGLLLAAAERSDRRLDAVETHMEDIRQQLGDQTRRLERLDAQPAATSAASTAAGDDDIGLTRNPYAAPLLSRGARGSSEANASGLTCTSNMLIVGGFRPWSVREGIRTAMEAAIGALTRRTCPGSRASSSRETAPHPRCRGSCARSSRRPTAP